MKNTLIVLVLLVLGFGVYTLMSRPDTSPFEGLTVSPNQLVVSPLMVAGKVPGTWYFEASFPVQLVDANGTVLAQGPAQAGADWMTPELVPFSITLNYAQPETDTGTLILEKDNPSGLPENAAVVRIPVRFK